MPKDKKKGSEGKDRDHEIKRDSTSTPALKGRNEAGTSVQSLGHDSRVDLKYLRRPKSDRDLTERTPSEIEIRQRTTGYAVGTETPNPFQSKIKDVRKSYMVKTRKHLENLKNMKIKKNRPSATPTISSAANSHAGGSRKGTPAGFRRGSKHGNEDSAFETDDQEQDDINICLSDTKFENLKHKKTFKQKVKIMLGIQPAMSSAEFQIVAMKLYKCCLKSVRDLHELHQRRLLGMQLLDEIIKRAKPQHITIPHVIHIIWSIMSCIHHFQLRLKTFSSGIIFWARKKKLQQVIKQFTRMIRLFKRIMHRIILNAVITFYKEARLWEVEFPCTELVIQLLEVYKNAEEGIEDILHTTETCTLMNIYEAKMLIQVLFEILKKIKWHRMSERLMKKIVMMYESSISPKSTDSYNYTPLRKGLEISIRNIIGNLGRKDLVRFLRVILRRLLAPNPEDEVITAFGAIANYAAKKYRVKAKRPCSAKGPIPLLFGLLSSNIPRINHMCLIIWKNLMDVHNNAYQFLTPKIYFQYSSYNIVSATCRQEDKLFYKSIRHFLFEVTLFSLIHACNRLELEDVYQAMALTIAELPCGYVASCHVSIAMAIQEFALCISTQDLVRSHHIHAFVLSIMTLICYIFKATVFYDYVNTIMKRRAEWAPHLNPPLRAHYEYAQHHILWNKPDLFFEDWETRYGLWKCFRENEPVGSKKERKNVYRIVHAAHQR
ncbi:unnamed protein product [Callosobruchus maculatus]|uniref:Uncharacterized protein n=1 Tax=Callosobruchus maculatus TaxID=64391 RepID=A0A653C4P1_CALMS|nr:unnamed protein product [Callosobruchus maculatus]